MAQARIVSLVPSLTELVWWFGLGESLVGRTRFCTEPEGVVERIPIVGGTKNPKIDGIVGIRPDIVLANREENRREDIEALSEAGLRVILTDPNTVPEAIEMVRELSETFGCSARGGELVDATERALAGVQVLEPRPRVFVPIWKDPWMGLGSGAYGHDLLERAGATNVLGDRPRYPEVELSELADLGPDLILLPDEPYPFKPAHAEEIAGIAPARVIDGKLLWWYGPRMPGAIRELSRILAEVRT